MSYFKIDEPGTELADLLLFLDGWILICKLVSAYASYYSHFIPWIVFAEMSLWAVEEEGVPPGKDQE